MTETERAKRVYSAPRLFVFGTLQSLTLASFSGPVSDGAGKAMGPTRGGYARYDFKERRSGNR